MSNRLLTAAWRVRGLSCPQKSILTRLADFANDHTGECFPSHERIAKDCTLNERTVRRALSTLAEIGHITIREDSQRTTRNESRFTYVVHPVTPDTESSVRPDSVSADTGLSRHRHRTSSALTPDSVSAPYITNMNQFNHKGEPASPDPSQNRGRKRQPWQLSNDQKEHSEQLRLERQRQSPDPAIIAFHVSELGKIREEMRSQGMATGTDAPEAAFAKTSGTAKPVIATVRRMPIEDCRHHMSKALHDAVNIGELPPSILSASERL